MSSTRSKPAQLFGLVDCNSFYVSCEQVFQPHLEGRPVVVLSNNDGCVIARSDQAKKLGIAMGAPYFKIETFIRQNKVAVFSSNYALYGDMSRRVTQVLANFAPSLEVYSIDEAFLDLSGMPFDLTDYGLGICDTVKRWTGIPVSIGIGPTKTLSKIANRLAKKGHSPAGPVLEWAKLASPETTLAGIPVEDIWGISTGWGSRLRALGIENALSLREADPKGLRPHFGVVLERIVRELRGVSCLPLETVQPARKHIMTSRSFGEKLTRLDQVRAAVVAFAARSGEKLREQGLCAEALTVFIHTSPFETDRPQYSNAVTLKFNQPSQDSSFLIDAAVRGLKRIFRSGYAYQRAGVLLPELVPVGIEQAALFDEEPDDDRQDGRLMNVVDEINRLYGRNTLRFASADLSSDWRMRQQFRSPSYTTHWLALPTVGTRLNSKK
jgi:DNA polymerase V